MKKTAMTVAILLLAASQMLGQTYTSPWKFPLWDTRDTVKSWKTSIGDTSVVTGEVKKNYLNLLGSRMNAFFTRYFDRTADSLRGITAVRMSTGLLIDGTTLTFPSAVATKIKWMANGRAFVELTNTTTKPNVTSTVYDSGYSASSVNRLRVVSNGGSATLAEVGAAGDGSVYFAGRGGDSTSSFVAYGFFRKDSSVIYANTKEALRLVNNAAMIGDTANGAIVYSRSNKLEVGYGTRTGSLTPTITAYSSASGGGGKDIILEAEGGRGTNQAGGTVTVQGGTGNGAGGGGAVHITGASSGGTADGAGGDVVITAGASSAGAAADGSVYIYGGDGALNSTPGNVVLANDGSAAHGKVQIKDGTQGSGYYMVSDANGIASWSSASPSVTNQKIVDSLNSASASEIMTTYWRYTGSIAFWAPDTFRDAPPRSINTTGGILRTEQWGGGAAATATDATALGNSAAAAGASSLAVGSAASANAANSTAIGAGASTVGARCTMVGAAARNSGTTANDNTLIGFDSKLSNGADSNTMVGASTIQQSGSDGAVVIGVAAESRGSHNIIIGNFAKYETATGFDGVAIGDHAKMGNTSFITSNCVALGKDAASDLTAGTALGSRAHTSGNYATAVGIDAVASGTATTAIGDSSSATHDGSTAIGRGSATTAKLHVTAGKTSDTLDVPGYTQLHGLSLIESSPAQITSNQDNYPVYGFSVFRLSTDATRTVTGFIDQVRGRMLYLFNVGANDLIIANQNASSSDSCRVITGSGADDTVHADQSRHLWYDSVTRRWRRIL